VLYEEEERKREKKGEKKRGSRPHIRKAIALSRGVLKETLSCGV
jgi:hypothetical protein